MSWNINFDGKTKLKDWWGIVRDNFIYLKNFITEVDNSIGTRIAEARGINPTKHIVENATNKSMWLITDRYFVPITTTNGAVAYEEYAYVDSAWQVIGSTMEADIQKYIDQVEVELTDFKASFEPIELWTNPDTTVEFEKQTIELYLTYYDRVHIIFYNNIGSDCLREVVCTQKGKYVVGDMNPWNDGYIRDFTISNTGILFGNALYQDKQVNTYLIPYKIIGYLY